MHRSLTFPARAAAATVAVVVVAACAATGGADWTYAPLGPTPSAGASGAPTPGGSPAGTIIEVATPQEDSLAFVPNTLEAPANTDVTIRYTNDSNIPHNIHVFEGADNTAPSLGATEVVTGPDAVEDLTFTTPGPGDYYFLCDVHGPSMAGTLHVQ
jgi:plastocyanin